MSVFAEMRANRAQQAEIRRADRAAEREQDRADQAAAEQRRTQRAAVRRERVAAALRWVGTHPIDLLTSVIVVVPGLLAWTAMALFGETIYGPVGWLLPAFSEAGMWAFAFAAHAARRQQRPTGWLLVGVVTFTAIGGGLNFLHGFALGGWLWGVVMAVVSVGGVIAHQLLTAAPMRTRRTRAQRRAARTERLAARRVTRMERAALRQAIGELTADGTVRLVHQPGTVTLARGWSGRTRLDHAPMAAGEVDGSSVADSVAEVIGTEVEQWLSTRPESTLTRQDSRPDATDDESGPDLQESRPDRVSIPEPTRRSIDVLRAELAAAIEADGVEVDPTSAESIRRALRCGAKTARQLRDEWNNPGPAGAPA